MTTIHRRAAERNANQMMSTSEGRQLLADVLFSIHSGFYDPEYLAVLMQKYWGKPDFVDAYAFLQLHTDICLGKIASCKVDIGAIPFRDDDVDRNNEALMHLTDFSPEMDDCDPSFGAYFAPQKGGGAQDDGAFWWEKSMKASFIVNPPNQTAMIELQPRCVPLEVGYTEASRTLLHLRGDGAVARWPYGSTEITVLVQVAKHPRRQIPYHRNLLFTER